MRLAGLIRLAKFPAWPAPGAGSNSCTASQRAHTSPAGDRPALRS